MSELAHLPAPQTEQLTITGFPVEKGRTLYALTNDKKLLTDQELRYNQNVTGTFSGRVKGLNHVEIGGDLHAVFVVEVLTAELT